jgi:hypothetical protein
VDERSFQRFAGAAAMAVGLSSIVYGLVFLFAIPADQKGAPPASLSPSGTTRPAGRSPRSCWRSAGSRRPPRLSGSTGIYRRVRAGREGWALWSLTLGVAFGVLTGLHGLWSLARLLDLSALYDGGDAATQAAAVVLAQLPSPVDPFSFSKFFLTGLWLLVTGWLMLVSASFPRLLAYVALAAGAGVLLLFVGTVTGTAALIFATGVPGSAVVGPLFWLWTGWALWRGDAGMARAAA